MMLIRKEQLEALAAAKVNNFEVRALEYLRQEYPQEYQQRGEYEIRQLLQRTIKRVKHYELDTEIGVMLCVELSFVYGERFYYTEPWAQNILNHFQLDVETKVERLQGYILKA